MDEHKILSGYEQGNNSQPQGELNATLYSDKFKGWMQLGNYDRINQNHLIISEGNEVFCLKHTDVENEKGLLGKTIDGHEYAVDSSSSSADCNSNSTSVTGEIPIVLPFEMMEVPELSQVDRNSDARDKIGYFTLQVSENFLPWHVTSQVFLELNFLKRLFKIQSIRIFYLPNTLYGEEISDAVKKIANIGLLSEWLILKCEAKKIPIFDFHNQIEICSVNNFSKLLTIIAQETCLPLPIIINDEQKCVKYFYLNLVKSANNKVKKLNTAIFYDADNGKKKLGSKFAGVRLDCVFDVPIKHFVFHIHHGVSKTLQQHVSEIRQVIIYNHLVWGFLQSWIRSLKEQYSDCFSINDIAENIALCYADNKKLLEYDKMYYNLDYRNLYLKFDPMTLKETRDSFEIKNFETNFVCNITLIQYYRQFFLINDIHYSDALRNIIMFYNKKKKNKTMNHLTELTAVYHGSNGEKSNSNLFFAESPILEENPRENITQERLMESVRVSEGLNEPLHQCTDRKSETQTSQSNKPLTKPLLKTRTVEEINSSVIANKYSRSIKTNVVSQMNCSQLSAETSSEENKWKLFLKKYILRVLNKCWESIKNPVSDSDDSKHPIIVQHRFNEALQKSSLVLSPEEFIVSMYTSLRCYYTKATCWKILNEKMSDVLIEKFPTLRCIMTKNTIYNPTRVVQHLNQRIVNDEPVLDVGSDFSYPCNDLLNSRSNMNQSISNANINSGGAMDLVDSTSLQQKSIHISLLRNQAKVVHPLTSFEPLNFSVNLDEVNLNKLASTKSTVITSPGSTCNTTGAQESMKEKFFNTNESNEVCSKLELEPLDGNKSQRVDFFIHLLPNDEQTGTSSSLNPPHEMVLDKHIKILTNEEINAKNLAPSVLQTETSVSEVDDMEVEETVIELSKSNIDLRKKKSNSSQKLHQVHSHCETRPSKDEDSVNENKNPCIRERRAGLSESNESSFEKGERENFYSAENIKYLTQFYKLKPCRVLLDKKDITDYLRKSTSGSEGESKSGCINPKNIKSKLKKRNTRSVCTDEIDNGIFDRDVMSERNVVQKELKTDKRHTDRGYSQANTSNDEPQNIISKLRKRLVRPLYTDDSDSEISDNDHDEISGHKFVKRKKTREKRFVMLEYLEAKTRIIERLRKRSDRMNYIHFLLDENNSNKSQSFSFTDPSLNEGREKRSVESINGKSSNVCNTAQNSFIKECLSRTLKVSLPRLEDMPEYKIYKSTHGAWGGNSSPIVKEYEKLKNKECFRIFDGKLYLKEQYCVKNGKIVPVDDTTPILCNSKVTLNQGASSLSKVIEQEPLTENEVFPPKIKEEPMSE